MTNISSCLWSKGEEANRCCSWDGSWIRSLTVFSVWDWWKLLMIVLCVVFTLKSERRAAGDKKQRNRTRTGPLQTVMLLEGLSLLPDWTLLMLMCPQLNERIHEEDIYWHEPVWNTLTLRRGSWTSNNVPSFPGWRHGSTAFPSVVVEEKTPSQDNNIISFSWNPFGEKVKVKFCVTASISSPPLLHFSSTKGNDFRVHRPYLNRRNEAECRKERSDRSFSRACLSSLVSRALQMLSLFWILFIDNRRSEEEAVLFFWCVWYYFPSTLCFWQTVSVSVENMQRCERCRKLNTHLLTHLTGRW